MKIKCAECVYARENINLSIYSKKRCGKCELRDGCKLKKSDRICEKQILAWAAMVCSNVDSEYRGTTLNMSSNGDRQKYISWGGCAKGKRGCGQ